MTTTRKPNDLQKCKHCKLELPLHKFHNDRRTPNRVYPVCKSCRSKHRRLIDISESKYKEILESQNNECAICCTNAEEFKTALSVDHDYSNDKVRGLLCTNCNMGLGQFKDSLSNLHRAMMYLAKHNV
jgi:protein-arginine kinase activator protein McsA